ncbi:Uma2 family endonuclease [Thiothrix nivea]|nr:Uma2 family endonuclease [Thiothrix nivea]
MGYALLKDSRISPDEYLAGEQIADEKYEYIDGEVYAMAGRLTVM